MMMSICLCLHQDWLKLENVKENNKEEIPNIFWLCFLWFGSISKCPTCHSKMASAAPDPTSVQMKASRVKYFNYLIAEKCPRGS